MNSLKKEMYHIKDRLSLHEIEALGLSRTSSLGTIRIQDVRAIKTGEKRPPKKGEWFISGAIPEAYKAYDDLDTVYHIAHLVRVREETVYIVEKELR